MRCFTLLSLLVVLQLYLSAAPRERIVSEKAVMIFRNPVENFQYRSNSLKVDPFKMAFGGFNFSYEHFISDYRSFSMRAKYNSFGLVENFLSKSSFVAQSYNSDLLRSAKLSHWGLDADYRIYFFHQKPRQGLYLGPYAHYENYKASAEAIIHTEINGLETDVNLIFNPTVNLVGAGFETGMQWLIHNRVSIEWKIFAVGGNVSMLNMHYASDNLDAVVDPIDPNIAKAGVDPYVFLPLKFSLKRTLHAV